MPETPPPAPLWVKVFGAILALAIVVFVVMHLMGRGLGGH